jgi:hypothetical protein
VRPAHELDLTVDLDSGQFYLSSLPQPDGVIDALVRLVDEAATGQGIAVRITGRGFLNYGWPGSTTPGDEWRLQLWPGRGPDAVAGSESEDPAAGS